MILRYDNNNVMKLTTNSGRGDKLRDLSLR